MQNADTSYSNWTLPDLKQAASGSKLDSLAAVIGYFNQGDAACQEAAASFMTQVKALGSAWQGAAAQAATSNATSTHQSMVQMQHGSKQASTTTTHYDDTRAHAEIAGRGDPERRHLDGPRGQLRLVGRAGRRRGRGCAAPGAVRPQPEASGARRDADGLPGPSAVRVDARHHLAAGFHLDGQPSVVDPTRPG